MKRSAFSSILFFAVFFAMTCASASATPTITAPASGRPGGISISSTTTYVFPAKDATTGNYCGETTPYTYPDLGTLRLVDTMSTSDGPLFTFHSTALASINSGTNVCVAVQISNDSTNAKFTLIPPGAGYATPGFYGDGAYGTLVKYPTNDTDISFRVAARSPGGSGKDLCTYPASTALCSPGRNPSVTAVSLVMGLVSCDGSLSSTSPPPATQDSAMFNILFSDCPPGLGYAPNALFTLVPGDGSFRVDMQSAVPTDPAQVTGIVVYADPGGNPVATAGANMIRRKFDGATGSFVVDGVDNDKQYTVGVGYLNAAGFVSTGGPATGGTNWGPSVVPTLPVTPQQIRGFLDHSTCFIATAAYGGNFGDERLHVLYRLRDEILKKSDAGRKFIQWYYGWSPKAANWLIDHPNYSALVRMVLFPVVELARVSLWLRTRLWITAIILVIGTGAVLLSNRRRESAT